MVENLSKLLERDQKIDIIVHKSKNLEDQSKMMRRQAQKVRNQQKMKNIKLWIAIIFALLLVIYFILVFACGGFALSGCFGSEEEPK